MPCAEAATRCAEENLSKTRCAKLLPRLVRAHGLAGRAVALACGSTLGPKLERMREVMEQCKRALAMAAIREAPGDRSNVAGAPSGRRGPYPLKRTALRSTLYALWLSLGRPFLYALYERAAVRGHGLSSLTSLSLQLGRRSQVSLVSC